MNAAREPSLIPSLRGSGVPEYPAIARTIGPRQAAGVKRRPAWPLAPGRDAPRAQDLARTGAAPGSPSP
jgi:hypothetical protein